MAAPKIVGLDEIEKVTRTPSFQKDLIDAIAEGFAAYHRGEFFAAPIQTLGLAPFPFHEGVENYASQTCVKSGYFHANPYYVIKVASGGHPLENSGLMQVYSQKTGRLQALLLDEGILTELRTAAVGALSFKLFAPCDKVICVGMIGTGVQARYQLQMLANVTTCRNLVLYGRSPDKARNLQKELQSEASGGWNVTLAHNPDDLLTQCDVVVTTTCSREPVLTSNVSSDQRRTRLITCIGSDAPGKVEVDPALVKQADVLVADCLKQTRERGEFQAWCADKGSNKPSKLVSLGAVISEKEPDLQRKKDQGDSRLFIFDSSGVALQDCVIAQMVFESLLESG